MQARTVSLPRRNIVAGEHSGQARNQRVHTMWLDGGIPLPIDLDGPEIGPPGGSR